MAVEQEVHLGADEHAFGYEDVDDRREDPGKTLAVFAVAIGANVGLARVTWTHAQPEIEAPHRQRWPDNGVDAVLSRRFVVVPTGARDLILRIEQAQMVGRAQEHVPVEAVAELGAHPKRRSTLALEFDVVTLALGNTGHTDRTSEHDAPLAAFAIDNGPRVGAHGQDERQQEERTYKKETCNHLFTSAGQETRPPGRARMDFDDRVKAHIQGFAQRAPSGDCALAAACNASFRRLCHGSG